MALTSSMSSSPTSWPEPKTPVSTAIATIFLVDDDPMVTDSLQTFLSLETDHAVYTYNHPAAALHALASLQPALVISDFLMPDMNGIEFLQQVKQRLPETTCILLTGYADKENAISAINRVGLYRYLEKPWDNNELLFTIQNGLERARLVQSLHHTIDELQTAQRQLQQHNHELEIHVMERTKEVRELYSQLQLIVNSSADGILLVDGTLRLLSANPVAATWLQAAMPGTPASKKMMQQPCVWLPPEAEATLTYALSRMTPESSCVRFDLMLAGKHLEANVNPIESQQKTGYIITVRDVTHYRETERLREDFVSTLTHDMRTPLLAAIQTFGLFLDGTVGPLTAQQEQLLTVLTQSHRDLLGLVNTLLEVYKYEAGQQTLIWDAVDVPLLLRQVVEQLTTLAQAKGQTIELVIEAGMTGEIRGDRQELRRVWVNLIGNAIHHTPADGAIRVTVEHWPLEGELQVCVADNGRGIARPECEALFQRFSQGTSSKRNSGTGLGLYLSRQIVEAHRGRIWVESDVGHGSRFTVALPTG
jgi:signal transduction histidine kinase/DNA-binding NarL/FixJ family response regulator